MADEINREKVEGMENVYSVDYTQDIDEYTKLNSDVVKDKVLYYTDLDISAKAELFTTASEAKQKADDMIRKFPNHIVKFYMFYYTETYGSDGKLSGVRQELCQVVPGTKNTQDDRYRDVKRKNLKKTYDKIDFITVYRPLNGIKWYTVSKQELAKELAVIKEFYGLTNFPDKVGDYYFSKKIGKWLATEELSSIIAGYEAEKREIPVIYIDEIEQGYIKAEKKTILEIIWDYILNFITGIGNILTKIFGNLFNPEVWEQFWKDENNNWVPDKFETIWNDIWNYDYNGIKIFNFSSVGSDNANTFGDFLQDVKKWLNEILKIGDGASDLRNINAILAAKKEDIKSNLHSGKDTSNALWNWLVGKITALLGIDIDSD